MTRAAYTMSCVALLFTYFTITTTFLSIFLFATLRHRPPVGGFFQGIHNNYHFSYNFLCNCTPPSAGWWIPLGIHYNYHFITKLHHNYHFCYKFIFSTYLSGSSSGMLVVVILCPL